jgi:hypothetical protein
MTLRLSVSTARSTFLNSSDLTTLETNAESSKPRKRRRIRMKRTADLSKPLWPMKRLKKLDQP